MEENQDNVIEIRPINKWKRLLVFLGDYFVAFIISFVLFNLAIFPLAKVVFNTQQRSEEATLYERRATNLLVGDGYLYALDGRASFEEDVNYTFKVFLSYYAFDEAEPFSQEEITKHEDYKYYGHKEEYEVIRNYYKNVINDTELYINDFKEVNNADAMFTIDDTVDSIALKADYKTLLRNELVEVRDESKYSVTMTNFRDHVFAKFFYLHVYDHILENDYVKGDISYKKCLEQARDIMRSLQWVATGSTLFTILLTWSIVFVLYPLLNKDHKTIASSMMRISKLHYKSLGPIDKTSVMIQSFYQFLFLLSTTLFMPILYFGFAYSFNLPLLFFLSAISLGFILISGAFILFIEYNRSATDILTNIVLLPDSEIDMMYRVEIENGK